MKPPIKLPMALVLVLASGGAWAAQTPLSPTVPSEASRDLLERAHDAPPSTAGHMLRWDRYAAAWWHAVPVTADQRRVAARAAAVTLGMADGAEPSAVEYSAVVKTPPSDRPGWVGDHPLQARVASGTEDITFYFDLGALAQALETAPTSGPGAGLTLVLDRTNGMLRASSTYEHRLWLTDVVARMVWEGRGFVTVRDALFTEARDAFTAYGVLRHHVEAGLGHPVRIEGPFITHPDLRPGGRWRYQEVMADGLIAGAQVREAVAEKKPLRDRRLFRVVLPTDPEAAAARLASEPAAYVEPADGHSVAFMWVPQARLSHYHEWTERLARRPSRKGGASDAGPKSLAVEARWLPVRAMQDRGWEPVDVGTHVQWDAAELPFSGVSMVPPGLEERALVLAGASAASLAGYPTALKSLVEAVMPKVTRVHVVSTDADLAVILDPTVSVEQIPLAVAAGVRLRTVALVGTPAAPTSVDLWVDLPRAGSGRARYPMIDERTRKGLFAIPRHR